MTDQETGPQPTFDDGNFTPQDLEDIVAANRRALGMPPQEPEQQPDIEALRAARDLEEMSQPPKHVYVVYLQDHHRNVARKGAEALRAQAARIEALGQGFGDLMAVINGDGGHRAAEFTTKQEAGKDAEKRVVRDRATIVERDATIERLHRVRPFADHHATCEGYATDVCSCGYAEVLAALGEAHDD